MSVLQTGIGPEKDFYPYAIDQSLRFNDDDSAYLSRTPATAGNRQTMTISFWVKPSTENIEHYMFSFGTGNSGWTDVIRFANNKLTIVLADENTQEARLETERLFRDFSAWYHVIIVIDTTEPTSSNRMGMYINGEKVTNFSTEIYPAQNFNTRFLNTSSQQIIGENSYDDSQYFDGYLAEINFIDGQALDPTSFGEFKSGVWVANEYTGTYGTNGFYLPFENGLGNDESGNGNDWTPNNLAATDIVLDSPTNNFATMNPLYRDVSFNNRILSQGNLKYTATNDDRLQGTFGVSEGKWYWETNVVTITASNNYFGVVPIANNDRSDAVYWRSGSGSIVANSTTTQTGLSNASTGDVVGTLLDMDAGTVTFYLNNTQVGSAESLTAPNESHTVFTGNGNSSFTKVWIYNFGQDSSFAGNETAQGNTDENGIGDFYYTPPAGNLLSHLPMMRVRVITLIRCCIRVIIMMEEI